MVQLASREGDRSDLSAAPLAGRRLALADRVIVVVLLAAIPVVHDVGTMLTAPYWLDEAWVALSVRFPLSDLPVTTASTPIGWTFLLRLVPDSDYLRVVTLGFHALTVVAAYAFGRLPHWSSRRMGMVAGVCCAAMVLLLPAQQLRHDLKQYTADAAVTLSLLALVSWTERRWSRRRLGVLAAAIGGGMLLSHVTAIVAPCVFGGLLLATVVRRRWLRAIEVVVAGLGAAWVAGAIYVEISARGRNEAMQRFWVDSFPRLDEVPGYLGERMDDLNPWLGASTTVVLCLFVAGMLTLANQGRPATATAVLLLPAAAVTMGVVRVYPLLELRTSHFLLVTAAAVAGVAVTGLAALLATPVRRMLAPPQRTSLVAAACAIALGAYAGQNYRWYRFDGSLPGTYYTAIAVTDIRSSTEYVARHRSRNDVVVMNNMAWYGYAFYSTGDPMELVTPYGNTVGWWVAMPTRSDIVVVPGFDAPAIRAGLDRALKLAGQRGGARIWLIRSHVTGAEVEAWRWVLADYRVEQVTDGVEPVALISEG